MDTYPTYLSTVVEALGGLYEKILTFLPNLIAAIVVVILGWLVAVFLSKLVMKILEAIKIDVLANQLGLENLSSRVGRTLSFSRLGAWLIKWFFFLGSFVAATEILGLQEVTTFLYDDVLGYAGHVVIAMAILLLGILAAHFFSGLVANVVKASGVQTAQSLGSLTRWAIMVFTVIAALSQLQIAKDFLVDLFRAFVAMLAIAGGIAFGLGGKDHARKILDGIESDINRPAS